MKRPIERLIEFHNYMVIRQRQTARNIYMALLAPRGLNQMQLLLATHGDLLRG